ncbi:MAG TPA: elongation factor P [Spirochaetota bacterium]|nr:elongation factor P [Spirochaetota bacterium]
MISSNDFKKGMAIKINSDIFTIVDFQHVKPGKGAAFVRSKLKSLTKGTVLDKTFRAGEKVEDIRVEKRGMQYSYDEGDSLVFMDTETYDEFRVNKDIIGNLLDYIKEGDTVEISVYEEKPISIDPPIFVELLVTYAEPGVRGDTATNVNKPVTVETGAQIHVPIFVNQDDIIKIDTRTGEYVERVKK